MKKIFGTLSLTLVLAALSACGSSDNKSESLSYDFEFNGCKTGKHTFSSTVDLCKALKNADLNNGCALSMRKQYFESSHCADAGVTWEG